MEEVKELKERVGYIEREKIAKIEEDITQIRMGQVETNTIVKEFSKAIDKQCDTMNTIKSTLQEMVIGLRDSNKNVEMLNTKFDNLEMKVDKADDKFNELNDRVEKQEEKGKVDWILLIKNKGMPVLIGGGLAWFLLSIVKEIST